MKNVDSLARLAFPDTGEIRENDAFCVRSGAVAINNGRGVYNLPLHCPNSQTLLAGGSRPMVLLWNTNVYQARHVKFGELAWGICDGDRFVGWLHDFDGIEVVYEPGRISYALADKRLPGVRIDLTVVPLVSSAGVLARVCMRHARSSAGRYRLFWSFGGLAVAHQQYCPWDPGQTNRLRPNPEDCRGNLVKINASEFILKRHGIKNLVVAGRDNAGGVYLKSSAVKGDPRAPFAIKTMDMEDSADAANGWIAVIWGKEDTLVRDLDGIISAPESEYKNACEYAQWAARAIVVRSPERRLDAGMQFINYAADACWRPPSFFHSSSTWIAWYTGWRQLYGPTVCGWHNRVRSALQLQSNHTSRPAEYPRDKRMERLENAYIARDRHVNGRIHMATDPLNGMAAGHHDCDQLFIDFAHHHYCWTGDTELVRELWTSMIQAAAWQKAARDPDNDGLYVNVLNTWISDSHEYHEGAGTTQSAYLWKNNMELAEMAVAIGKNPAPFLAEAAKIKQALFKTLWLNDAGVFAEYRDAIGVIHPSPESTSIYHPIEFGLTDMFQSDRMLRYAKWNLLNQDGLLSPSQWLPQGRCCHKTPFVCETLNMALAAYYHSQNELAFSMLKACFDAFDRADLIRSGILIPMNPQSDTGNIDMLDNIALFQRAVVEGLYGIRPEMQKNSITITPNTPSAWKRAEIVTPDAEYQYIRQTEKVEITLKTARPLRRLIRFPFKTEMVTNVTVNGKTAKHEIIPAVGHYFLNVPLPMGNGPDCVAVFYKNKPVTVKYSRRITKGGMLTVRITGGSIFDAKPAGDAWKEIRILNDATLTAVANEKSAGHCLLWVGVKTGKRAYYEPIECEIESPPIDGKRPKYEKWTAAANNRTRLSVLRKRCACVSLDGLANENLGAFFERIPSEVRYGYALRRYINRRVDDSYLQSKTRNGVFISDMGMPFNIPLGRKNAVFLASRPRVKPFVQGYLTLKGTDAFYAHPYPDSAKIPIDETAVDKAYVLFTGATSWMQSFVPAVRLILHYNIGNDQTITWSNPESFDFFMEHADCHFCQPLTKTIEPYIYKYYRRQEHADIAEINVDSSRRLMCIDLKIMALDTSMAVLGVTLLKTN